MKSRAMRRVTVRYTWDRLKVSFWFAPLIMSLGAIFLAWGLYWLDLRIPNATLENSRLILSGSVGEMRNILLGMAGTILATAGVVFTLLTLPLSTVAAQYGSRLLRVFLGDRTTQVVLAMFVSTFVYCLAAALSIPPITVQPEGPQLMATMGMLLALATFGSLILLIQHISTMMQAPNIAAAAGVALLDVVSAEMPDEVASNDTQRTASPMRHEAPELAVQSDGYPICVNKTGYIQYIDPEYIVTLAREKDLIVRLLRKPGNFVSEDVALALVWPAERIDERLGRQIRRAFQVGNQRTPTQDIAYAINQLVEMAVRAMSPAINDPFTAMTCLDYIGRGLALFVQQGEKLSHYYDKEGRLRVILEPITFQELLGIAFDMLRHCCCDNTAVLQHILEVITVIGDKANSLEARQMLLHHVCLIQAESQSGALIEADRQLIQQIGESVKRKWAEAS